MKFEEVLQLEMYDGVIYEGQVATVTNIKNLFKGQKIYGKGYETIPQHNIREIEITFDNSPYNRYLTIYTDYPNEAHNQMILNRLEKWDPLGFYL